jgi:CBS domain-containing protein
MQIKEIMTSNPACCVPETSLKDVAAMMIDCDCGEIPVVEDPRTLKPVGVVTDRDIVCRTLGKGLNPMDMTAGDVMTTPAVTVTSDADFEECCSLMEEKQIRRIPVVDADGAICGIVALADIAKFSSKLEAGEVVQEVSEQTTAASNVG